MTKIHLVPITECVVHKPGSIEREGSKKVSHIAEWTVELARASRVMDGLELVFPRPSASLELRWGNASDFAKTFKETGYSPKDVILEQGVYVGSRKPYALVLDSPIEGLPHNLIAAHEIAHYIDNVVLGSISPPGGGPWFSTVCPLLSGVRQSISESWTVRELQTMLREGKHFPTEYVEYLLRPEELFARAFVQYVVTKSDDSSMAEELSPYLDEGGALEYVQWHPAAFHNILVAFDDFFLALKR